MCCGKKISKYKPSPESVQIRGNRVLNFFTKNFFGKILFFLFSFLLMLGIPFVVFYVLFINNSKQIIHEE